MLLRIIHGELRPGTWDDYEKAYVEAGDGPWPACHRRDVGRVYRLAIERGVGGEAYHAVAEGVPFRSVAAAIGRQLGLLADGRFGEQQLGFIGASQQAHADATALAAHVEQRLGRRVTCIAGDGRPMRRIAWCSGGAQGYFESAIAAGADAFLTGEVSEPQAHLARETGVAFLACGHHATERYGAPALAAHAAEHLGLDHRFIDIDNPA